MGKQADIVKSVEFKNIPPMMDSPQRSVSSSLGGPVSSVCDLVPSCASSQPQQEPQHQPQEYVTRVCVELGILNRNPPPPSDPPILLCAVDFEQYPECKYNVSSMDTADNCVLCVNSKHEVVEPPPPNQLPIKSCLKNKEAHPIYRSDVILKESPSTESEDESQAVSDQDTNAAEDLTQDDDPNMDGMLDLISHDLDYLLNRNNVAGGPSGGKVQVQANGETKPFILDKIQEESL